MNGVSSSVDELGSEIVVDKGGRMERRPVGVGGRRRARWRVRCASPRGGSRVASTTLISSSRYFGCRVPRRQVGSDGASTSGVGVHVDKWGRGRRRTPGVAPRRPPDSPAGCMREIWEVSFN